MIISVIIPVYNAEKYIEDLINSLIDQSFKDFEVIIVDDGSTDNSIHIAENALKTTNLIYKIISQDNKGQSVARNIGIKNSVGEWIVIPDSDDVLHPDYLKKLYNAVTINNTNVAYCNFKIIKDGNNMFIFDKVKEKEKVINMNSLECMKRFVKGNWIGPWSIIINRTFFITKNLWFDEKCRFDEDLIFVTKLICEVEKICEICADLYNYRKRDGSVLNSSDFKRIVSGYNRIFLLKDYLHKNGSEASSYFEKYGFGDFILGKVRIFSKRFDYKDYKLIAQKLNARMYILKYIKIAPFRRKIAAIIFVLSNKLFYYIAKSC